MAIIDDTAPPAKKGPSTVVQVAVLAAMTVAALGIGWLSGTYLTGTIPGQDTGAHDAHGSEATQTSLAETAAQLGIVYLDPITTNMAGPVDMWVRLEYALVFEGPPDLEIAHLVQQDSLAYLRTLKSHQVDGASGFQHLRADLEERAVLRSDGKVKGILVKTLLFE